MINCLCVFKSHIIRSPSKEQTLIQACRIELLAEMDHIWKTQQQVKIYQSRAKFPEGTINTLDIAPVI
jgi:hypothetical protein